MTCRLSFGDFIGPVVTWSDYGRKCTQCRRMIGYRGTSYRYVCRRGCPDPQRQVCQQCHRRNFRRWERLHPKEEPPHGK